jgi:hypothetical protein
VRRLSSSATSVHEPTRSSADHSSRTRRIKGLISATRQASCPNRHPRNRSMRGRPNVTPRPTSTFAPWEQLRRAYSRNGSRELGAVRRLAGE